MSRRRNAWPDEEGASLVIALVFTIAIAFVILSLIRLTGTNLINSANLQIDRSTEYSADGVVDGGIQMIRTYTGDTVAKCAAGSIFAPSGGINNFDVVAYCGNVSAPKNERVVTFEACSSSNTNFTSCEANSLLEAVVTIVDVNCPTLTTCTPSIGYAVTVDSWTVKRANS